MSDKIDMMYDLLLEMRKDQEGIRDRQIDIVTHGCPTGSALTKRVDGHDIDIKDQDNRLKKVEKIIAKAIAAGLVLASGTYGGGKLIEVLIGE